MPKYILKLQAEASWGVWVGALVILVGAILEVLGVDSRIIIPAMGFVAATARLGTGAALPSPSTEEAVQDVIKSTTSTPSKG